MDCAVACRELEKNQINNDDVIVFLSEVICCFGLNAQIVFCFSVKV